MESILNKLLQYQIQALHKGIDFDVDMNCSAENKEIKVKLCYNNYTETGELCENMYLSTTFTGQMLTPTITRNFDKIDKFIQNVTVNPEEV